MDFKLLAKYLSGEMNPEEEAEFALHLKNNMDLKAEVDKMAELWLNSGYASVLDKSYAEKAYMQFTKKISFSNNQRFKGLSSKWMKIAAAFLLIAVFSFAIYQLNEKTVKTGNSKLLVSLPDKSEITLNTNSELITHRWIGVRKVKLNGEGYFNIQHNGNKSFEVKTTKGQIKVLGTTFYVNAYMNKNLLRVKVTSGKVLLKSGLEGEKNEGMILSKGEMGEVNYQANTINKFGFDDVNDMAWNTGKLVFKATPLNEVFMQLQDVYTIQIKANMNNLDQLKYTGIFENTQIDIIVKTISGAFDLKSHQYDDQKLIVFYE